MSDLLQDRYLERRKELEDKASRIGRLKLNNDCYRNRHICEPYYIPEGFEVGSVSDIHQSVCVHCLEVWEDEELDHYFDRPFTIVKAEEKTVA